MGGQRHAPAALPPGKRPGTHCIKAWWAPGPVWKDADNLTSTGIRSPDRPAGSQSLYQLIPAQIFALYINLLRNKFEIFHCAQLESLPLTSCQGGNADVTDGRI